MGLLKHLLFWPVTGPAALVKFSVGQIEGVVRGELTDDSKIKEDLMALQMQLELGDIDEAEYDAREAELMARLRDAREWRNKLGMEKQWTPLSFSRKPGESDEGTPPPGGETEA